MRGVYSGFHPTSAGRRRMDQETISPGRRRGAGVTGEAIDRMRELIASGEWGPGTRLPREADLAKQLGLSRNSLREAVRALSLARVLERMHLAGDRADELVEADAAFHDVIAGAPGNGVLQALLRSLSTRTVRARLWHGLADRDALDLARQ